MKKKSFDPQLGPVFNHKGFFPLTAGLHGKASYFALQSTHNLLLIHQAESL